MRMQLSTVSLMILGLQTSALYPQTTEQPAAGFALSVSVGHRDGMAPEDFQVLRVRITYKSDHVEYRSFCGAIGAMYDLEVKYNGVLVPETEEHQRARLAREVTLCTIMDRRLGSGDSKEDNVFCQTSKPGTYEFTVIQDTSPRKRETKARIRSNALTIVVP